MLTLKSVAVAESSDILIDILKVSKLSIEISFSYNLKFTSEAYSDNYTYS